MRVELVDDRGAQRLGQRDERGDGAGIAPDGLGENQRPPRRREDARGGGDRVRPGHRRRRLRRARRRGVLERLLRLGQHLARKREVHGALRLRAGDGERTIHDRLELQEVTQLVVPLHELAREARLVERLLRPVDRPVARAGQARLGDRIAPRGKQHRHADARGVDDTGQCVGGTDDDVDHYRLRPPGHHRVAVRHGHRRRLVRHRDRSRQRLSLRQPFGPRLDERREVGARVGEHVLDAAGGEQLEIGFGRRLDRDLLGHGVPVTCRPSILPCTLKRWRM